MRAVALGLLLAVAAASQTVRQSGLVRPDGRPATGYLVISATSQFSSSGGGVVTLRPSVIAIRGGTFSVTLRPNAAGTAYSVVWVINGAASRTEFWCIPSSSGNLAVENVVCAGPAGSGGPAQSWTQVTSEIWAGLTAPGWSRIVL